MLHRDLERAAKENQRLRLALELVADEVDRTAARFFLVVTKAALRQMATRVRTLRWGNLH